MKVWPIDPLVPRNLRLEVPEKLPQGLQVNLVPGSVSRQSLVQPSLYCAGEWQDNDLSVGQHTWMRGNLVRSLIPSVEVMPLCEIC